MTLRRAWLALGFVAAAAFVSISVWWARGQVPVAPPGRSAPRYPALPAPSVQHAPVPAGPRLAFRYQAGGPITSPVALDARGRIYLASHDGRLHALDTHGQLRFTRPLGPRGAGSTPLPPAWGGPRVLGERVFAGSDAGWLWAFGLDGEVRASLDLAAPIERSPAASPDGGLWVASGRRVVALSPALVRRHGFEAGDHVFATPAVDRQGRVYVAAQDDFLHALDAQGALRFRHRAGADLDAAPLWVEGRVFIGSDDGYVVALSDADGAVRWRRDLGGPVRAPLAWAGDGTLIATTLGPVPRVVALDARDGRERWSYSPGAVDSADRGFRSGACVDGAGRVYVGGHDDHLHALTADGVLRYRFAVRGDVTGTPVLRDDGLLIFGTEAGWLYGLGDP